ncbi:FAD-dependent oxidoreductase [Calothrix sp. 336/3]|uniref:FAD-dependent oxidoreductase n=1 Tax=Calothrix sp. 336/3 TaxID=1337936 RepID=UPI0004E31966|nr:NAD(P)/FAD-dependent oxidoreductase [Calothrix sp. 336/3]AKG24659.1 kynurenine 3-monooxygenase [Calothrix sp. 336/3]
MAQKVIIIGAGPAGLLLAHYLLLRGKYQVEIYERRPQSQFQNIRGNRSFPLSLQERGRKALRYIPGLETAIANQSVFCQGTIIYQKQKKPRSIPRKNTVLSIDRNRIVGVLLEELTQRYSSEQIQIHFACECIQVNHLGNTVTLQSESGNQFTVSYDLLVGADGANSYIRAYLEKNANFHCEQEYIPDFYKSLFFQRTNPSQGIEFAGNKIHTSNLDKTRIILVPQLDNQLNGVIIFGSQDNPLVNLSTQEEVIAFFQDNFPDFAPLMSPEEATALLQRPFARVLTVRCDRFHQGDNILLIGDAVHAVSPSIGQGCNSSLEDVFVLGELLEKYDDDWSQVLPSFSQKRIPDVHALRELSDYSFPRNKLLVAEFFLRLSLGRFFHKLFPRLFVPFLFDLILDTDIPYSQISKTHQGWINKVKSSMGN